MNRRTYLASVAGLAVTGLAGCGEGEAYKSDEPDSDFSIVNVEVVKQATRVGVKVTVASNQFAGDQVPVKATLYNNGGEPVRTGYFKVGLSGGETAPGTIWFEFDSVAEVDEIYSANADIVSETEYDSNK